MMQILCLQYWRHWQYILLFDLSNF